MFSTMVSFIPKNSNSSVYPKITQGTPDSVWVKTRTDNETEIRAAAAQKLDACYGVDTVELSMSNQFEY